MRSTSRRRLAVLNCCKDPLDAREGYNVSNLDVRSAPGELVAAVRRSDVLVFDSPWAVDQLHKLSDIFTSVYLIVFALGRAVLPRSSWSRCPPGGPPPSSLVHFRSTYTNQQHIAITDAFATKHALLCKVLESIAQMPSSKWSTSRASDAQGTRMSSLADARAFLISVRRVEHSGGGLLGGQYFSERSARR